MSQASSCAIVPVSRQITAVIRAEAAMADIPNAQRSARGKLAGLLPTLGAGDPGLSVTLWKPVSDGRLYMEMGVIVSQAFTSTDEVVCSELPAGRAAHYRLVGGFEGLPGAWGVLFGWCEAQALDRPRINWEIYGETPDDPADQAVDLYSLLA